MKLRVFANYKFSESLSKNFLFLFKSKTYNAYRRYLRFSRLKKLKFRRRIKRIKGKKIKFFEAKSNSLFRSGKSLDVKKRDKKFRKFSRLFRRKNRFSDTKKVTFDLDLFKIIC